MVAQSLCLSPAALKCSINRMPSFSPTRTTSTKLINWLLNKITF